MTLLEQCKTVRTVGKNLSILLQQMEFELITVELTTVSPCNSQKILLLQDSIIERVYVVDCKKVGTYFVISNLGLVHTHFLQYYSFKGL